MPVLVLPNVFVNGTVADADLVNQNFNQVVAVVNALDHFNVGTLGFYASQIRAVSVANGTFGGSAGYTFTAPDANTQPLNINGVQSQNIAVLQIDDYTNTPQVWVDKNYNLKTINDLYAANLHITGSIFGLTGGLSVDTLTVSGAISGGTVTTTGQITSGAGILATSNVHAQGNLVADNNLNVTGAATVGGNATITGTLTSGAIAAPSANVTGTVTAGTLTSNGNVNAVNLNGTGTISAPQITATTQVTTPVLGLGLGGTINFGVPYEIMQLNDNLTFAAGAQWVSTAWVARNTIASIIQASQTSDGMRFMFDSGLTGNNQFTPTICALINALGIVLQNEATQNTRYNLPYGSGSIGSFPGGIYIGSGFHYDNVLAAFVCDANPAVGIMFGVIPGATNRCLLTFQTGLTVGATFTPNYVMSLGTGGTNQMIFPQGISIRNNTVTTGNTNMFGGSGAPAAALGANGDFYFNNTGAAGTRIYFKAAGAWAGIV